MESFKEWPQTKCSCPQMTQVFLKFPAPSWTVMGGCVSSSHCAALCSGVTTLIAATKGDTRGCFTLGAHNYRCDNPSVGFCEERGHKRTPQCPARMPHGPVRMLQGHHAREQPWGSAFCPPMAPSPVPVLVDSSPLPCPGCCCSVLAVEQHK